MLVAVEAINILHITSDQQRTSTLGCYGNDWAISPNIDKLASEGTRFTDAYTASPVCSPSRTSVLLGVHVPIHGVVENGVKGYHTPMTNYFDILKKRGYHTALIGKTHYSPLPKTIDHLDVHSSNSDMRGPDVSEYDFLETYLTNQTKAWITNITSKKDGKPWYAYLSMVSPHNPNWVPGKWQRTYDGVKLPPLNYKQGNIGALPYQTRMLLNLLGKELDDPPAFPMGVPNMSYIDSATAQGTSTSRYDYYNQAAYVDSKVGEMMSYLEKAGLDKNTLVIFSSDHGSQMFDHGIGNDKHNFLDASWRVPLVMRFPGVLPANTTRSFASTLDITATIVSVAGAAIPASWQGFDLVGPISQGKQSPRQVGIGTEYRAHAIATPSWKLSYFPEEGEGRLFNRKADPEEQFDLFNSTEHSTVKYGLLTALLRWRAQQDPLQWLQTNSKPGAQTATLAYNHTEGINAIDAEVRLQSDALNFEIVDHLHV